MGDAMTCDSCGAILQDDKNGDLYCPNEECTGILSLSDRLSGAGPGKVVFVKEEEDIVNKPNHYKLFGTVEVIDMIKELLTEEEFRGYLCGNVLKYRLRAGKKGDAAEDIAKALRYEAWLKTI